MGYAARMNPNSNWNKKRAMNMEFSGQTTFKEQVKAETPRNADEPMVIQITPGSIFTLFKEFLCRMLKLPKRPPSLAPNS